MPVIRICIAAVMAVILCLAARPGVAAPFSTDSLGQGVDRLLHLAQAKDDMKDMKDDDDEDDDDKGVGDDDDDGDDDDADDTGTKK